MNKAIEEDRKGNYAFACNLYLRSLYYFNQALKDEKDDQRKQWIESRMKKCQERAQQLERSLREVLERRQRRDGGRWATLVELRW
ncbi:hypothetical protein CALCODRAFT_484325 [Calocera cornea HHB12733]|uniref:MIT domain-containing protein n=1 Tax=Calocera cornea HHB12733 TaxID=1353952 RepID=A0A165F1U7_9BASI|nr:hypothetical protein CALCODRAFT_484325 [Calocera cornea HHB12733]